MTKLCRQVTKLNLVQRFSLRAFVVIISFASIFAAIFTNSFRYFGEEWERSLTEEHILKSAHDGFPLRFFEEPAAFSPEEIARVSRDTFLYGDIFRVKFWDADMTVIWSDEERLIGQRFPNNDLLARALGGEVTSKIEEPHREEHEFEKGMAKEVMEVYVPVRREESGPIIGAIEVYRDAEEFLGGIRSASLLIWGVTLVGSVILFLALIGIVIGGQREQERLEGSLEEYSRSLEEERQKLEGIVNGVGAGLFLVDRDHKILWANDIAHRWFGNGKPLEVGSCHEAIWGTRDACADCPTDRVFAGESIPTCERFLPQGENRGRYFQIFSSPIRDERGETKMAVELIQDVTERKNLEAQLVQAGQLAAVGELAAKVAHEVNNPVGIIGSLAKLLLSRSSKLDLPDEVRSDLEKINTSADRIAQVTTNLLSFTRPPRGEKMPVHLGTAVRDSLSLAGRSLASAAVQIDQSIPADLAPVLGHPSRLGQVVLNLVNNAVDAMPDGGRLTISAGNEPRGDQPRVWLRFTDTGGGIPGDLRPVIFDPFVTTKRVGKGTGLGLSVTRDIVEDHGGTIEVEKTSGEGTTFRIILPAVETASAVAGRNGG